MSGITVISFFFLSLGGEEGEGEGEEGEDERRERAKCLVGEGSEEK